MFARKKHDRHICGLHIGGHAVRLAMLITAPDGSRRLILDAVDVSMGAGYLQSIADAFRELTFRHGLRRYPVAVVLDGDYCVTRISTGSPGEVDRDLQRLATRVPRYLSLGPGEKITGGYRFSINKKVDYAVTGVANRRVIEALQHSLRECDLAVTSIEPTMVAVARAMRGAIDTTAPLLLADGSGSQWDVGIVQDGRLLLDYRPSAARESDRFGETLCGHMPRLHRFCQRHRHLQEGQLNEVYLHGPADKVRTTAKSFANQSALQTKLLTSDMLLADCELPEEAHDSCTVGAVAAALSFQPQDTTLQVADLLSTVRMARQKSFAHHLTWTLIPVTTAATVLLSLGYLVNRHRNNEIDIVAETGRLRQELAEFHSRSREIQGYAQRLDVYETLQAKISAHEYANRLLEQLPECLPNASKLTRVQASVEGNVRLTGTVLSESMVYDLTTNLRKIPGVADVLLEGTTPRGDVGGSEMDFALVIKMHNASTEDEV